jgi:hypothetical protein
MSTIIGLIPDQREISTEVERLVETGIPEENILVLAKEKAVREILGCDPICTVRYYAIWGALLVGTIYGIFGIVAAWCECNLLGFNQPSGMLTLIGGVLAGGFVGGILGAIIGLGESEENTHLYTQGVRIGNRVLVLQTESGDVEKAKKTLRQVGCIGVRMIPKQEVHA